MARLSSHVLDLAEGRPAAGLRVELVSLASGDVVVEQTTDGDGRCLLAEEGLAEGSYELRFHAGDYLRQQRGDSPFLDVVPVRFKVAEGQRYHVPLLLSPYGYSTYRGS